MVDPARVAFKGESPEEELTDISACLGTRFANVVDNKCTGELLVTEPCGIIPRYRPTYTLRLTNHCQLTGWALDVWPSVRKLSAVGAADMLASMLAFDPAFRATAAQALEHNFFNCNNEWVETAEESSGEGSNSCGEVDNELLVLSALAIQDN